MKKILSLVIVSLFCVSGLKAGSADPVFKWGAFLTTDAKSSKGTGSPVEVKKNAQNEVFVFGNFGTTFKNTADYTSKSTYYLYNPSGTQVFEQSTPIGASYGVAGSSSGNATNNNIYVYKLAGDGAVEWQVTSNEGDVYTTNSSITPTSDGGVFLALKVRHTNYGENGDVMFRLLDNDGIKGTEDRLEYGKQWTYQGYLAKISNAGEVTSLYRVHADTTVVENGFQFNSVVEDTQSDAIYLAGSCVVPLTFRKAGGGEYTIDPQFDYTGWNKDYVQYARGYPFLVKLNTAGELLSDFTPIVGTGTAAYSNIKSMDIDASGNLYVYGNMVTAAGTSLDLNGKIITQAIAGKYESFVARVLPSGQLDWISHFTALTIKDPKGGRNKITSLSYSEELGAVFACGSFSGPIGDANQEVILEHTNTGTSLQGFVLKIDAASGAFLKGASYPAGGINEVSAAEVYGNRVHAIGYTGASLIVVTYDTELVNETSPFTLISGTNSVDGLIVDNLLLAYGRGRGAISFPTTEPISMNYPAFNSALAAYTLPQSDSGLDADRAADNGFRCYTSGEGIVVECPTDQWVKIVDVSGRLIAYESVSGVKTFSVRKGIYIVNGWKLVVH